MMHKIVGRLALFLTSLGAINWGLVAFLNFNLISYTASLVGFANVDMALYGVIGLSGLYSMVALFYCPVCS